MKQFNFAEDVVSTEITVTDGFGDGGVGILQGSSFSSSSLSAAQKQYYYNLQYNYSKVTLYKSVLGEARTID